MQCFYMVKNQYSTNINHVELRFSYIHMGRKFE